MNKIKDVIINNLTVSVDHKSVGVEKVIITTATIGLVLSSLLVIGLSVFWLIVK